VPCRNHVVVALACGWAAVARAQQPLTLDDAVRGALLRNERAAIADQDILASEARLRRARALFFPDLKFTGEWRRRPEIERTDPTSGENVTVREPDALTGTLEASLTVIDARSFPLHSAARLEVDAQRLDSREARRGGGWRSRRPTRS